MAEKVVMPVELQVYINNLKEVTTNLQNELQKVDVGSSIYRSIKTQLTQAEKLVKNADLQANIGITKQSELDRLLGNLQKSATILDDAKGRFSSLNIKDLNLSNKAFQQPLQDIETLSRELERIQQQMNQMQNTNVATLLKDAGESLAGFSKGNLAKGATQFLDEIETKSAKAAKEIENLKIARDKLNDQSDIARGQVAAASPYYQDVLRLSNDAKAFNANGRLTNSGIAQAYQNFINNSWNTSEQKWNNVDKVQSLLKLIGLDDKTIQKVIQSGSQAIQILQNYFQNHQKGLTTIFSTEAKKAVEAEKGQAVLDNNKKQINEISKHIGTLEKNNRTYTSQAESVKRGLQQKGYYNFETEINKIQNNIQQLWTRVEQIGRQGASGPAPSAPGGAPGTEMALSKQQAGEQFSAALTNMSRRWVGTYAIINKVRQGIHQAWTDIQGLDKAMTNIAVVTNMSVDDLWGKINDYMSIAQQYGVTTQGVYEVSQLYYQQGLGTKEVMAATTETLKMARIAGMDYAAAANAMTVAIRSFKMEMTDAAHVTDVYSKVAAVTASDSEELATAMSKTASSAESVGSSFENTTAMLAVMIETTRESAQNLGSALKSIISRYGEMKSGLTQDSEGEEIDYNKTDAALKSVGISLKDAQGQFRNFDEVIFELSEKWDTLDKNTQRYIATIMAGNRQQSRFIALVDNWERLDEVANAAQDSEDAGLLQYSKTLDSLETKINNLKTSFQELYMSIANGPAFKSILDFINNILQGFARLKGGLITFIPSLIVSIKSLFAIIGALGKTMFAGLYANAKNSFDQVSNANIRSHTQTEKTKESITKQSSKVRADTEVNTAQQANQRIISNYSSAQAQNPTLETPQKTRWFSRGSQSAAVGGMTLNMLGTMLNLLGANTAAKGGGNNLANGAWMQAGGGVFSGAGMGLMMGGPWGALIGGLVGLVGSLPGLIEGLDKNNQLEADRIQAEKEANEANIKRAETKEEYESLKSLIEKVEKTEEFKNDSEEAYQQWVDANNALVEQYPEMLGYIDEYGNSIADLTNSSEILAQKMLLAAESASKYYEEREEEIRARIDSYSKHQKKRIYSTTVQNGFVTTTTMEGEFYDYLKDNDFLNSLPGLSGTGSGITYSTISRSAQITPEIIKSYADTKGIDLQKLFSNLAIYESGGIFLKQGAFTDQEQSLYDNLLQELKFSKYIVSEDGKIQIDENLQNYLSAAKDWQELQAIKRSSLNQSLSTASYLTTFDDSVQSVEGFTSLLAIYAQEIQKIVPNEDLYDIYKKPDEYKKLVGEFVNFYESLELKKQEIFNSLYEDLNNFTLEELEKQLEYIGAPENIASTYKLQWYQKNYSTKSRLVRAVDESFFSGYSGEGVTLNEVFYSQDTIKKLGSYSEWLQYSDKEGTLQDQQEYYDLVAEVIGTSDNELRNFILKSTTETGDAYIKILRSQTKIIDSGGIAGDAAKNRLSEVQRILQEIYSEDFLAEYSLSEDFNIEEYSQLLLADNIGSQEWANALEDFEKKYNLDLTDFNEYIFENFGTYLAQITENMNSAIEDFKNISEVQSKGIDDFEKALKYYEDYAGDLTWDDFYTWTEDGKLIFKNIDQVFSQIGNDVIEVSKQYNQALEAITLNGTKNDPLQLYKGDFYTSDQLISSLNPEEKPTLDSIYSDMDRIGIFSEDVYNEVAAWWDWIGEWDEQDIEELKTILAKSDLKTLYDRYKEGYIQIEDLTGSLESFGFTEEQLHDIQTWLTTEGEGKDASYDELLAYLQEQADLLNAQSEYYIQQRKSLAKQARQQTFSTATEGDIKAYNDKQLVGQIIQSGNEFTKEQLQSIGKNLDATYDEVVEIFSLQYDPNKNIWVQKEGLDLDASKTLIQNKVTEATKAYNAAIEAGDEVAALQSEIDRWKLIQTYFDGTDDIYTRLFNSNSKWKEINDSIITYNKGQIFSDGEIDLNELKTLSENEKILTNLLDKEILIWNDALQSFELTQTLTDEQKAILKTAGIDPDTWTNLVSKQTKSWQEQAYEIILEGGKDLTSEQIGILKEANLIDENMILNEGDSLDTETIKSLASEGNAAAIQYLEDTSNEIEDSLISYITDLSEVTFSDLAKTYETITGKKLDDTTAQEYQKALEDFQQGEFQSLIDVISSLATQAKDKGFNINEETLIKNLDYDKLITSASLQDSLNSLIAAPGEVTLDSIKSLYDEIYGEGSFVSSQNFDTINTWLNQAKEGSYDNIIFYIQSLYKAAAKAGYDIDISEIETLIQQFYESIIETLGSALSAGIEGSLDTATFNDLVKKYGISGTKTVTGYSLGSSAQRILITEMYKAAELSGSTMGFGEQLWKTWSESANAPLKSYAAISDELDKAINKTGDLVDATDEYVKALEQARAAAYLDPNAYEFSFMDQDATSGLTQNFDSFVGQIETVQSTLETLKGSGAVGYQEFYNLIDFINKSGQWDSVSEKLGKAGMSAREFANTIVEASGEIGKVDAKGFAEINIDMMAAANAFGEGMEKGLRDVADQQIKYLTGLENMLLAMQALNGLNAEAGIDFSINYNENGQNIPFTSFEEILDHYQQLPKEKKSEFLVNIKQSIENLPGNAGELVKIFGGDGDISEEDLIIMSKIESAWDEATKETREKIITSLQDLTQEQGQWLAEYFASGETTDIDIGKLFNFLMDPETIGQSFGSQLQNAFSKNYQFNIANIPISVALDSLDGTDFKLDGNLKNLGPGWAELEKQLNEQLAKEGLEINEIDYETGLVTVKKLNIPIDEIQKVAVKDEDENGEVSYKVPISGDIELIWEKGTSFTLENVEGLSSEEIQKQISEHFNVALDSVKIEEIIDDAGIVNYKINIDFSTQKDSLTLIQEDLAAIREAFETGIELKVENDAALDAINAVKSAIDDLPDTHTIFITTIKKTIDNTRGRPNNYVAQGLDGKGSLTGNMNNITGSALADGNVANKLLAGANLANKTLVGELGPELAVYNGKYHMLGANGAEFVNLPSDAIVFNHLQTAGILRGQMNVRGQALAEGNVSGPALAGGGIDSALAAVRRAKAVWQGLLDNLTAAELAGAAGGGGGGGGDVKNHSEELQEWYNLSRQISNIEQEINNILAERENITEGDSYLRSLREQQKLLREQANIQEVLLGYQQLQLKRQADIINNDRLWSRFLEVDESGLLQYTKGNELNGGKGALQVLQEMNEMSGEDQVKFLEDIGYTYTTVDGEELKQGELVQKFYEELQKQIDDYDALYDTVHETKETLEGIDTNISEIDEEIKQNQMDLEEAIFDIIVEAWEKQIEQMEEYNNLVKEANDKYIDGLNDALEKEKELYSQNETIAEREQLQRRLSLLRRSGGSASEIASLEEQLDDKLKDEYFKNQEDAIKNIQEANDRQVELLEQQVKLQQDSLEYQKEHGVIWSQVYDIMSGSAEEILAFMQGRKPDFFTQSLLQQEEMLTDWAMKIGIYTEDKQYQNHEAYARGSIWDNGNIFNNDQLKSLQGAFSNLTPEQQQQLQEYFSSVYATSRVGGADEETATQEAIDALKRKMGDYSEQQGLISGSSGGKEEQKGSSGSGNKNKPKYETRYSFTDYTGKKHDGYKTRQEAEKAASILASQQIPLNILSSANGIQYFNAVLSTIRPYQKKVSGYSQGGIVDYTGLAMVHGSKSKPESFLNAEQTAQIREALKISGNRNMLEDVRSSLQALQSTIKSITNIANNSETSSITIAPGAIVIEVAELADSYDVDTLSADVMNRIVNIANKRTTRSVNRR